MTKFDYLDLAILAYIKQGINYVNKVYGELRGEISIKTIWLEFHKLKEAGFIHLLEKERINQKKAPYGLSSVGDDILNTIDPDIKAQPVSKLKEQYPYSYWQIYQMGGSYYLTPMGSHEPCLVTLGSLVSGV